MFRGLAPIRRRHHRRALPTEVRAATTRCRKAALPENTVLAVLLGELMPGLIHVHGSDCVAVMLHCLADELGAGGMSQSIAGSN
jgi:hypothetical protein